MQIYLLKEKKTFEIVMQSNLIFFLIIVIISSCKTNTDCNIGDSMEQIDSLKYQEYKETIDRIFQVSDPDPEVTWQSFFDSDDFIKLYENPEKYLKLSIFYISDKKNPDKYKMAPICSNQKYLSDDCFIYFIEQCCDMFEKELIDSDMLRYIIVNELDIDNEMSDNYDVLKKTLDRVACNRRCSNNLRKSINRLHYYQ